MTRKGQRQCDKLLKAQRKQRRRNKVRRDMQVSKEFGESAHRSCGRKARYETREQAEHKASMLLVYGVPTLRAYECRYCGGWHLTKQPLMSEVVGEAIKLKKGRSDGMGNKNKDYRVHELTRRAAAIDARLGMEVEDIASSLHISVDVVRRSIDEFAHLSDEDLGIGVCEGDGDESTDAGTLPEVVSVADSLRLSSHLMVADPAVGEIRPVLTGTFYVIVSEAGTPVSLFDDKKRADRVADALNVALEHVGGARVMVTSVSAWEES